MYSDCLFFRRVVSAASRQRSHRRAHVRALPVCLRETTFFFFGGGREGGMTKTTRLLCSVLMWSNSTVRLQVKQIWREREQKKVLVLHRAFKKKKKKRINST